MLYFSRFISLLKSVLLSLKLLMQLQQFVLQKYVMVIGIVPDKCKFHETLVFIDCSILQDIRKFEGVSDLVNLWYARMVRICGYSHAQPTCIDA